MMNNEVIQSWLRQFAHLRSPYETQRGVFDVSRLKFCLDPTGGSVTLQSLDREPGMTERREMEKRATEVSGEVVAAA